MLSITFSFERLAALLLLVFLLPVFSLVSIVIAIFDGLPVFYSAKRVGAGGSLFKLYKFRTMKPNLGDGRILTIEGDTRITKVGHMLRMCKVDELPQLFNVVCGEMRFVGPRPEDPQIVEFYNQEQKGILQFTPGLTSPASIFFREESSLLSGNDWESDYLDRILPVKLKIDLHYLRNRSVFSDFSIVAQTFMLIILPAKLAQKFIPKA